MGKKIEGKRITRTYSLPQKCWHAGKRLGSDHGEVVQSAIMVDLVGRSKIPFWKKSDKVEWLDKYLTICE